MSGNTPKRSFAHFDGRTKRVQLGFSQAFLHNEFHSDPLEPSMDRMVRARSALRWTLEWISKIPAPFVLLHAFMPPCPTPPIESKSESASSHHQEERRPTDLAAGASWLFTELNEPKHPPIHSVWRIFIAKLAHKDAANQFRPSVGCARSDMVPGARSAVLCCALLCHAFDLGVAHECMHALCRWLFIEPAST